MSDSDEVRLVITGMGVISPMGCGSDITWERLIQGESAATCLSFDDTAEGELQYPVCRVPDINDDPEYGFRAEKFFSDKELLRTNRFIQLAVAATDEALKQSGWTDLNETQKNRTAMSIGTAIGGLSSVMEATTALNEKGRKSVSAFTCPLSLHSMAAGTISIKYGFTGPHYAPSTACAASLQAFDEAMKILLEDEADVVIVGGSEAPIHPLVFASFSAIKALSKNTQEPQHASRPFDTARDGFVIGEGAAVFIMEKLSHARARNAVPLVEVVGYGSSSDAFHVTSGASDGNGVARAMQKAITSAKVDVNQIDYLSAHATSTPVGDALEYKAIQNIFSSTSNVSISAIKGALGHLQGAANALAVGMTIKSILHQLIPETRNTKHFSENMQELDIVINTPRPKAIQYAMVNGFGFGGINASLILKKYDNG